MKKISIILFSLLLSAFSLQAQNNDIKKIDSLLNGFYKQGIFNGSALVSMNGKIIYEKAFGYANLEHKIPNHIDTKFEIGSCSKQFTSMLIMMLREKGKIKLDDKITDYIPEYPADKGNKITIHNLLSHTSGIPEYIGMAMDEGMLYKEYNPDEFMKNFWDLPLNFEPGSKLSYSNSNYYILGVIIQRVTGKSYAENLKENIFTPLNMTNSGTIEITEILDNKAYGYIKPNGILKVAPRWNTSGAFSAGNIYSTIEDLFKWQLALQSNSLITKESFNKMLTLNFSAYGYGFAILKRTHKDGSKYTLYGHEGEIPGFRSLINIIREDNSSVILLDNNRNTKHFKIAKAIRKILYHDN